MPTYRDEQIICIEVGSYTTRAIYGLAESLTPPKHRIPTKVARSTQTEEYSCGDDIDESNTDLSVIRPIVNGYVQDWEALTAFFDHVIYLLTGEHPGDDLSNKPVVLIVPPQWSPADREQITQIFMETFLRPALMLIDMPLASLYACNTMTGIVVDIGHEKTDITTIIDSVVITGAGNTVDIGGRHITSHLRQLLLADLPLHQAGQHPLAEHEITTELCESIKHSSICEVIINGGSGMAFQDATTQDDEGVLDIAAVVASGKTREYLARVEAEKAGSAQVHEVIPNAQLTHNTLSVNGNTIVVGQARFQACNPLLDDNTLYDAIYNSVTHALVEPVRRKELWENIVLVGGGASIRGYREMFTENLYRRFVSQIVETSSNTLQLSTYANSIKVLKVPVHFPAWSGKDGDSAEKGTNEEGTFLGAEIMAHIAFSSTESGSGSSRLYMSRNDYIENGPPGVHL